MTTTNSQQIGTAGIKWGDTEKAQWFEQQSVQRSYADEVLAKLDTLQSNFTIEQYGALDVDPTRYPLYVLTSKNWNENNKTVLVTGGVHGYETSGVQGAIRFAQTSTKQYSEQFNFIIAPCISPWGYETINRWNAHAVDPNRSFFKDSTTQESALIMAFVASKAPAGIYAHFDLHETTDTDNSVFRPALGARDAIEQDEWDIPDGFYAVGDADNPQYEFQKAIIDSVRTVTHIAPSDAEGRIIGVLVEQPGVINYRIESLGLCAGFTGCQYGTTTEVYPDSPKVDDENCILAQVAAVVGGLGYFLSSS